MTVQPRVGARCASHPARLAADPCPVCDRGRCAPDAAAFGARGCAVCTAVGAAPAPGWLEIAVRAGLAALAVAVAGGWVAQQYVNVHLMSLIAPALLGLAACWAATAAAGPRSAGHRPLVLLIAAAGAVLGTALGFHLFGRPVTPLHPARQVSLPYLTALAGVLAWPLLAGPPRSDRRRGAEPAPGPSGEAQPSGTRSNR